MKKKSLLWGIPIGFINGFFASGGGIIAVLVLQKFFALDEKKAHATSIMIILPLTVAGTIIYSMSAPVKASVIFGSAAAATVGALLGAKLLSRLSGKFIRIGFGVAMIIASCKLLFGG
ncbi:MAG: sulfite exporter TauE/SafE family protein [Clostridia bacterium]|nr:sulfite exporter TauE/SafE family protein [Clostridia bacterium]